MGLGPRGPLLLLPAVGSLGLVRGLWGPPSSDPIVSRTLRKRENLKIPYAATDTRQTTGSKGPAAYRYKTDTSRPELAGHKRSFKRTRGKLRRTGKEVLGYLTILRRTGGEANHPPYRR